MKHLISIILILISIVLCCQSIYSQVNQKNKVIVLTDIEADPDDSQSMIRLLLYSNVIDIKGLIAATFTHQKTRVSDNCGLPLKINF
jgi:muramoyltetrapeptide carboxypeptidase LdcA involved in peptidoglycan recycling